MQIQQFETTASNTASQTTPTYERTYTRRVVAPLMDIYETPDTIVLSADVPGVGESNIAITLENDVLTLEAQQEAAAGTGFTLKHQEWEPVDYRRVFNLNTAIDRDGIAATVKDGVLTVTLPKAADAKTRKIAVRAG